MLDNNSIDEFKTVYQEIKKKISSGNADGEIMDSICRLLKAKIEHYDWVGFYLTDPARNDELVLGPYAGEPTDHVRIPFGRGICGQAAERRETFVVQDVSAEMNYLSCNSMVRSEIVAPILKNGKVIGELDIDSHQLSPFTPADQTLIENICELLAEKIFT